MGEFQVLSAAEQVAGYLRDEIDSRRWKSRMPGAGQLARELNIGKNTIEQALALLEAEGYLENQGRARRRLIRIPEGAEHSSQRRIGVLLYQAADKEWSLTLKLFSRLQSLGYQVQYAPKSLMELKMEPQKVARSVASVDADAWVVYSASREVLKWFVDRPTPAFAMGGRANQLPIAMTGIKTSPARIELVRKLHKLGHRRIVMLNERVRREPPGPPEQTVLDEMDRLGIKTGAYNLPDWDDTPGGLRACLDSLFAVTPPHALIADTPEIFFCLRDYLQQRGIRVPQDVSIISQGYDPKFDWLHPDITRIEYDLDKMVSACVLWLRGVAQGRPSQRKFIVQAKLIEGGTIGPVPRQ